MPLVKGTNSSKPSNPNLLFQVHEETSSWFGPEEIIWRI